MKIKIHNNDLSKITKYLDQYDLKINKIPNEIENIIDVIGFNPIVDNYAIIMIYNNKHTFYCCDIIPLFNTHEDIKYQYLIQNLNNGEYTYCNFITAQNLIGECFKKILIVGTYLANLHDYDLNSKEPRSSFVSEINVRLNFENLKVVKINNYISIKFGSYNIYLLQDIYYNILEWKTSEHILNLNNFISLCATIKEHKIEHDVKITVITNGRIIK